MRLVRVLRRLSGKWLLGIVAAVWLGFLSRPFLLLGPLGYVRANELGDAVYPQLAYIIRMLRAGEFSLWWPAQGGGTDLLGNLNSPFLSILLFVALPGWLAHDLIFLIVTATASIASYLLLRRDLGCVVWTACLGAALYSLWFLVNFGGLVFAYAAGLSFALAPLVLHWLLRVHGTVGRNLLLSLALGLAVSFGGHYSWTVFILGTVFLAALLLAPGRILLWLPQLVVISVVVGIVQLPLFVANLETTVFSARTAVPYYWTTKLWPMIVDYYANNPPFWPYVELVIGGFALGVLAVIFTSSRWRTFVGAWPAYALAALFMLLPLIDVSSIWVLSHLHFGGFTTGKNGGFGGPFDIRFRFARAFVAASAIACAVDRFWRIVVSIPLVRGLIDWSGDRSHLRVTHRGPVVRFSALVAWHWPQPRSLRIGRVMRLGVVVGMFLVGIYEAWGLLAWARLGEVTMAQEALNGVNFSSFYANPELKALATAHPEFGTYRVATVELVGSDSEGGGPCCAAREGSLFGGFQNAYGFETADAYTSNLPSREVDYWDEMLVGRPAFPRLAFDTAYRRKFVQPESAFTQKLYLYEPIGSEPVGPDGCVRTQTPIDFAGYYNLNMLSLDNVAFIVSGVPLSDPQLTLLKSSIRPRLKALQCVSLGEHRHVFYKYGLVGRPLYIYRNEGVLPRVFAPQALETFADDNALYATLRSRSAPALARTALSLSDEVPPALAAGVSNLALTVGKVATVRGDHLRIEIRNGPGIVVVADGFSPYWQATAERKALPVFPVYHAFMAIDVPAGDHVIDLVYRPPYARWLGYR